MGRKKKEEKSNPRDRLTNQRGKGGTTKGAAREKNSEDAVAWGKWTNNKKSLGSSFVGVGARRVVFPFFPFFSRGTSRQ